MKLQKIGIFLGSIVACFLPAGIGNLATIPNIPSWYAALEKPLLNPPNWIFGPVWTTLYALMGISLFLVITTSSRRSKQAAYLWFGAQLGLNTLWSLVFFGLHSTWGGALVILLLIFTIIMTIREFWTFHKLATYLLVPYLVWVCFATYLTIGIAVLNG